jgi:hypothetical protein
MMDFERGCIALTWPDLGGIRRDDWLPRVQMESRITAEQFPEAAVQVFPAACSISSSVL